MKLRSGAFKKLEYEILCKKIRELRDWKPREVVGLRIDPPKITIKVGGNVSFTAIGKYSGGTEFNFTGKVDWPDGNIFMGKTPGKFTLDANYTGRVHSFTATADITVTGSGAVKVKKPPCAPPNVLVPYVKFLTGDAATEKLEEAETR